MKRLNLRYKKRRKFVYIFILKLVVIIRIYVLFIYLKKKNRYCVIINVLGFELSTRYLIVGKIDRGFIFMEFIF